MGINTNLIILFLSKLIKLVGEVGLAGNGRETENDQKAVKFSKFWSSD